jgi:DNA segregation ATPase FtsK/SpoIIIE, S-DNA-T family
LLVAGATWSGKSVAINTFILSLIYQNSPSELKFLMIDPKQVELGMYDGIPYLLAPVETVPDKALKILKWAVNEMERRYWLLKEKRVKNLDEFNAKVTWDESLPRIVVIIDELADLMMNRNTKKDTEMCITRIAQKARAIWIHLIVATQRPSVDVVTGLIKANIPTRIAFSVVSQIDSRTILDIKWAEELLGKWDMLYMDPANNVPIRMQAPLITTEETDEVVAAIKEKYMKWLTENDIYNQEIMNILAGKNVWSGMAYSWDGGNDDELVQQAIEIIKQSKKASATLFQRKLGVWFARAARIMDILEDQWMIWPQDGAKPRDIYI